MSAHNHFQEVKNAETLPDADKMGMCLNCKFWDVEGTTTLEQKQLVAVCVYPELKPYALVVSGTSACNKWAARPNVDPQAKEYSKQGEQSS
jgi:hypothetical protein